MRPVSPKGKSLPAPSNSTGGANMGGWEVYSGGEPFAALLPVKRPSDRLLWPRFRAGSEAVAVNRGNKKTQGATLGEHRNRKTSQDLFDTFQVFAGARVHFDLFANFDEWWHGDLQTSFQHCGFVLSRGRRSFHRWLCFHDLQLNRRR